MTHQDNPVLSVFQPAAIVSISLSTSSNRQHKRRDNPNYFRKTEDYRATVALFKTNL